MNSTKDDVEAKFCSQCADIKANLSAYCSGELDPATKSKLDEHLAICENCRADLEEYKSVVNVLLANTDDAITAPKTISPKKRKRMLWLMEHRFFALCVTYHRITALVFSIVIVALILIALFAIKIIVPREKPVSAPVTIIMEDPSSELPELDPEQPIPMD